MARIKCICKNCGKVVKDNFCGSCGQSAKTGRIDIHYIIHEIQHGILHVDKGILYTIKELLLHPVQMLREYLAGKRVNYFKPFGFVFILSAVYVFLVHWLDVRIEYEMIPTYGKGEVADINTTMMGWIYKYYALSLILALPFYALANFLVFRKSGYNYLEHFIILLYIMGMGIFFQIIACVAYYFFPYYWVLYIILGLSSIYYIGVLILLFKKSSWIKTLIKVIWSAVLFLLIVFIICIVIIILFILINYVLNK